jgi:hypothetical protein
MLDTQNDLRAPTSTSSRLMHDYNLAQKKMFAEKGKVDVVWPKM